MEALIYLDTHLLAWLFAGQARLLSPRARDAIEQNALRVSPMVLLELEFLKEIGRLAVASNEIFEDLHERIGIEVCDLAFQRVIATARQVRWTRDPFDRVIVGHAIAAGQPLLTKDRSIRRRFSSAFW